MASIAATIHPNARRVNIQDYNGNQIILCILSIHIGNTAEV